MRSITEVVERLYRGFAAHDPDAILAALGRGFVGHVSAGMPGGIGGRHVGPTAMLSDVWLPTFTTYDVTPVPETIRHVDDGSVLVHGWYIGIVRSSGAPVRAEFVHLIEVDDERIVGLRQITDTASWPPAP